MNGDERTWVVKPKRRRAEAPPPGYRDDDGVWVGPADLGFWYRHNRLTAASFAIVLSAVASVAVDYYTFINGWRAVAFGVVAGVAAGFCVALVDSRGLWKDY